MFDPQCSQLFFFLARNYRGEIYGTTVVVIAVIIIN